MAKTSKLNIVKEPEIGDIDGIDLEFNKGVEEDPILNPPKGIPAEEIEEELPKDTIEDNSQISENKTDTLRIYSYSEIRLNEATKPTSFAPPLYVLSLGNKSEIFSPLEQKIGNNFQLKHLITYDYDNPLYSRELNNYPGTDNIIYGEKIVTNLRNVMENCIDKIMIEYPDLIITSAYRNIMLNKMIGGSNDNNDHIKGHSIDFKVKNEYTSYIFNWCIENLPEWYELMWAYPERGNKSWIHISYIEGKNTNKTILASERDDIHEAYEGKRRGSINQYQVGITNADQNLV
jgi:hypothetical protein